MFTIADITDSILCHLDEHDDLRIGLACRRYYTQTRKDLDDKYSEIRQSVGTDLTVLEAIVRRNKVHFLRYTTAKSRTCCPLAWMETAIMTGDIRIVRSLQTRQIQTPSAVLRERWREVAEQFGTEYTTNVTYYLGDQPTSSVILSRCDTQCLILHRSHPQPCPHCHAPGKTYAMGHCDVCQYLECAVCQAPGEPQQRYGRQVYPGAMYGAAEQLLTICIRCRHVYAWTM